MVDLKLWFQSDLLKVTKVWLLTVVLFVLLFSTIVSWERFEPDTTPVQAECSNHYAMLPVYISFRMNFEKFQISSHL